MHTYSHIAKEAISDINLRNLKVLILIRHRKRKKKHGKGNDRENVGSGHQWEETIWTERAFYSLLEEGGLASMILAQNVTKYSFHTHPLH